MSFGEVIKKLRRNANMTQEQLAEMLSISPQAVSRWETDAAMPDISVLPTICNIFDVSSDELLGINTEKKKEKIQEISDKAHSFSSRGYYQEARELLESGLHEFPNAYQLMCNLMYVSYWQCDSEDKYSKDECDNFRKQSIELGERILESCTEDHLRHSAIQILCFAYRDIDEVEKAESLARTMPIMAVSQEALLARITKGTEQYRAKQKEIYNLFQFLGNWLGRSLNTKLDSGEWAYTKEEIATLRDKRIAIYDIMFENGDFGFYHCHMSGCHEAQAKYYSELADIDKTLYHLKKAAEHAVKFVTCFDENATHTSLIFKGYEYGTFSTSDTSNEALCLLEKMKKTKYDFVRESKEFEEIENSLQAYAEKWRVGE